MNKGTKQAVKLKELDTGTIVNISSDGKTFDMEFVNDKGKTYAMKTVQIINPSPPQESGWVDRFQKKFGRLWDDDDGFVNEDVIAFIRSEKARSKEEGESHKECYCVCHSELSSKPSCKHCERAVKMAFDNGKEEGKAEERKDIIFFIEHDKPDATHDEIIDYLTERRTP